MNPAIAQGRKAAQNIDKFLGGDGEAKRPWQKSKQQVACGSDGASCPSDELIYTAFTEVDVGFFEEMAEEEAFRCLNCQLIQQFLQANGKLPEGNDELDDLF